MSKQNHIYQFDLAIIGGGLAGLTLAIQSANAGHRVVLFEKEVYPFHKVCGEYISMESWEFLIQCGVPLGDWNLPIIHDLQVSDTKGKVYHFQLPLGGFGVSRFKLDNSLYTIALEKGVTMYTDCKVNDLNFKDDHFEIQTLSGNYSALMAAGSFGKRSNLDVKWGRKFTNEKPIKLNNFIGVKYHIQFPHDEANIALHNFRDGYCGMSRIENGISCLCYLTTAENLRKSGNSISEMEKKILSNNSQLAKIFQDASVLYSQPLTISQVSFQSKTQIENHLILLGDAAGMITPLCGNGMSMAMHASKIAFNYIDYFLMGLITRQDMEKQYEQKWKQLFSFRTRMGRSVQYFFGGSILTSVFLKIMKHFPGFSNMIIRQTHGKPF